MGCIFLICLIVCLDQVSKVAARTFFMEGDMRPLIPGFLSLTYFKNEGVAFSILSGHRVIILVIGIFALALISLLFFLFGRQNMLAKLALSMILGGGVGNMIDRFFRGQVTDMIKISFFPPIFNIADVFVVVGCLLLLLALLRSTTTTKKAKAGEKKETEGDA